MQLTLSRGVFSLLFLFSFMGQALAVRLAWDANSESNLAGYNVYRSDSSGSGHQRQQQLGDSFRTRRQRD